MPQSDHIKEVIIEKTLAEGDTQSFQYTDSIGLASEGLVIRYGGNLHAFKNVCRHQPLPLDYGDGEFMDETGLYLFCRNHAAYFEPDTGLCVEGPCAGASLFKLPVEEVDGKIIVRIPREELDLE